MRSFDTETVNRREAGYAVLLVDGSSIAGRSKAFPKSFAEIFDFLAVKSDAHYMVWNMDFDARAILHERFTSYVLLESLGLNGSAKWRGYGFRYIPGKLLRVWKLDDSRRAFELYDLQQFFGCSLRTAAKKYLGEDQQKGELTEEEYNRIDYLLKSPEHGPRVTAYAIQDARLVQSLFELLEKAFIASDIQPKKWLSAASISAQVFKGDMLKEPHVPLYVQEQFRRAFYGGRIESRILGTVTKCRLYDIRSAYPWALGELPSMKDTYFTQSRGEDWSYNPLVYYGSYLAEVTVPDSWEWGPLAVRQRGGGLIYPVGKFKTYFGLPALKTLRRYGIPVRMIDAWEIMGYEPAGSAGRVFPTMAEMYAKRKDPRLSMAVKLVMNSLYGKLCESRTNRVSDPMGRSWYGLRRVRTRDVYGRFANFILAAHTTEQVRMKIWEVLHKFQKRAIFTATDSVLLKGRIETGVKMGDWDLKSECKSAIVFGVGRYVLNLKEGPVFQFRGFNPNQEHLKLMRKCRRRYLVLQDRRTMSLAQWAQHGGTEDLNVLRMVPLILKIEDDRRFFKSKFARIGQAFKKALESKPWKVRENANTRRIDKRASNPNSRFRKAVRGSESATRHA